MKTWKRALMWLLAASMIIAACGAMGEPQLIASEAPAADFEFAREETAGAVADTASSAAALQGEIALPEQPLIIRTGSLSLVVMTTEDAIADIKSMVEGMGGWVVESNIFSSGQARRGNITVRVPVEQFDAAIAGLKEMAIEVTNESTSGQDVTEEYVDLSARLANLEATRDRVRSFLEEARNVEEALAVNRELSRLEGEIEQIKGRMQYLTQSAAFSTISVNLTPDVLAQPIEIAGWRPDGIARDAIEDLVTILQGLGTFLIRFGITVLPVLIIIFFPLYLVVRLVRSALRRRRANRQAAAPPPVDS